MEDTISIKPHNFTSTKNSADFVNILLKYIRSKFNDKVLDKIGLLIDVWDVLEIDKSFIFYGDGSYHTKVKFRYIVFRPCYDEVIEGKVLSLSQQGIYVTLGFFQDIFVPAQEFPDISSYDPDAGVWIWEYADEEDEGGEAQKFYLEKGQPIRFKVIGEVFHSDTTAKGSDEKPAAAPYTVKGSIATSGLGMIHWWR